MPNLWRIFWILLSVAILGTLLTFIGVWASTGDLREAYERAAKILRILGIWPAACAGIALRFKHSQKKPDGKSEKLDESPKSSE